MSRTFSRLLTQRLTTPAFRRCVSCPFYDPAFRSGFLSTFLSSCTALCVHFHGGFAGITVRLRVRQQDVGPGQHWGSGKVEGWFLAMKFRSWAGGRSADDGRWHNVCGGLRADGGMGVTVPAIGKLRTAPSQCEWLARLGVQLEWLSGSETGVRGLGMAANWEAQLDLVCSVFSQDWCALLPRRLRAGGAGYERGLCLCRLSGHCSTALQMGALRRCGAGSFRSWPWVVLGGGW